MVAEYNLETPLPGPNLMATVRKRLRIQGLIVSDQWPRLAEWHARALPLLQQGKLHYKEDIVEGLPRAPEAFLALLRGENFGKLVVRL